MKLLRMKKLVALLIAPAILVLFSAEALASAYAPQIIAAMGRQLDRQVEERGATGLTLFMTTPVDVNDLEASNPLARQVQEELATWFVQSGYTVQEIRKGADVLFEPGTGELLLTRRSELVGKEYVDSGAIVAGTYVVTPNNVRFNIKVVLADCLEVVAMSTLSIPINSEVAALLSGDSRGAAMGIQPNVVTLLP